ncbi:succinate-semialdehyde dehydrogenase [Methanosarcina sp. 2.H.T.1A.6]|uniref:NAD-dependent succinate-semialdehyde dehydrogenase n=1 Tax=unclassified Methanosarcina TaxID=2644672 RepID=UPI0006223764|nr:MULTISPECIES: NAD-dependent succinate-semialdehyde dehydrogenase [unclassified Methanosarcina]KKG15051.1 succinate-semialdehyde dehydrogenase [Methanosarcina sp. 2.H.T.1A.3]KKG20750.1 succinate-semialdehyde dehydrogenase [Methanosarcina sp. 2.H.T.1A.8]KKG22067.1 succinate-semialdehyde dehydrogenase [Methanosarcina sp. 2.H.T.1A.6]KKG29492.1 succinate-semialdehyde dehydrogenase [Methanosarcina sp. 2.H.T.1A.15]
MKIKSVNPYTEEVNWTYDALSFGDCEDQIEKSKSAFSSWGSFSVEERTTYIARAAEVLRQNKRAYAEIITKEMGKPIRQSLGEIEKCACLCDYYTENAADFLKDEVVETEAEKSYVTFEPLGIILGIMPYNYPFLQVFRFAVPALIAGNVCLLKHASNVPGSALEIEKVFTGAGLPEDVFKTLLIDSKAAMEILDEDLVDGVSLTGSVVAGSEIGELAGRMIKPFVLELGGSDPFIVLEDANIDRAAQVAVKSRFLNTGQSCTAAKRFIVIEDVVVDFIEAFELHMQELKIGDPMDEETDIGPVAKKEFVDSLEKILKDAKKKGAEPHIYGEKPENGFFFMPTLIPAASTDMKVCNVEVFGPIAPIIMAKDEDEAVEIANSTEFGLGAEVWSADLKRAERLAKRIRSGFVTINGRVKSDPRLPFGGVKKSGIGRELSYYGIKEFVNVKTIVVNK